MKRRHEGQTPRILVPNREPIALTSTPFTIGRNADADCQLRNPVVSRVHATLSMRSDGCWCIADHSTNGIWLDGERVEGRAERPLHGSYHAIKLGGQTDGIEVVFSMADAEREGSHPRSLDADPPSEEVAGVADGDGALSDAGSEEDHALRSFYMTSQPPAASPAADLADVDEDGEELEEEEAPSRPAEPPPAPLTAGEDLRMPAIRRLAAATAPPSSSSVASGDASSCPATSRASPAPSSDALSTAHSLIERLRQPLEEIGPAGTRKAPSAVAALDADDDGCGSAGGAAPPNVGGALSATGTAAAAAAPAPEDGARAEQAASSAAETEAAAAAADAAADAASGFRPRPRDARRIVQERSAAWAADHDKELGVQVQRFGAPPFSLLDARKGYWRKRRTFWETTYPITSELGRADNLIGYKGLGGSGTRGTSVFCPVLTELMYRWFCPAGGSVLDPFAGGSVRGCVAARTGLRYVGVDLSAAQVDENRRQANDCRRVARANGARWVHPQWVCADSRDLPSLGRAGGTPAAAATAAATATANAAATATAAAASSSAPTPAPATPGVDVPGAVDFVFSCPPYYDLEQYSDDGGDLSNAPSYAAFVDAYRRIIGHALKRLRPDRFACFVVGEIRDPATGFCRNFVADTIAAFESHGARLYNSAVMALPLHTLPMRAGGAFEATKKLGTCHQSVLVFFNGRHPDESIKTIGLHNATRMVEWY